MTQDQVGRGAEVFFIGLPKDIDFILWAYSKKRQSFKQEGDKTHPNCVVVLFIYFF